MQDTHADLQKQHPYTHTAFVLPVTVNQHSAWIIGLHYGFSPQPTYSLDIFQRNKHTQAHTEAASRPTDISETFK